MIIQQQRIFPQDTQKFQELTSNFSGRKSGRHHPNQVKSRQASWQNAHRRSQHLLSGFPPQTIIGEWLKYSYLLPVVGFLLVFLFLHPFLGSDKDRRGNGVPIQWRVLESVELVLRCKGLILLLSPDTAFLTSQHKAGKCHVLGAGEGEDPHPEPDDSSLPADDPRRAAVGANWQIAWLCLEKAQQMLFI